MILADGRATSPRSARASRPRSSASTATASRRSSRARTSRRSSTSMPASTAGRTSTTTGLGRELPRPLRRDGQPQRRDARRQLASSGSRRSAGTTSPPTRGRIDRMRGLLRDGMADGAFGLSSGLDYPPGGFATTDGARGTDRGGRPARRLLPHPRPLPARRPLSRPIPRGDRDRPAGGAPAHITHFYHRETHPGGPEPMLALVDDARAEGLDVTFDTYPYEWASTRLLIQLPQWIQAGGPGPLQGTARRPRHARPRPGRASRRAARRMPARRAGRTSAWVPSTGRRTCAGRAGPWPTSWTRPATTRSTSSATCSWRRTSASARSRAGRAAETLPLFVAHPVGMVGTDSTFLGDKPSPRTYGSFPRILGQFVRDEALLSLEEAIRKMTSAPAARLGLRDRGVIRDGAVADLVVFDPATVRSTATYDEPRSFPVGIEHVIVAGTPVVDRRHPHRRDAGPRPSPRPRLTETRQRHANPPSRAGSRPDRPRHRARGGSFALALARPARDGRRARHPAPGAIRRWFVVFFAATERRPRSPAPRCMALFPRSATRPADGGPGGVSLGVDRRGWPVGMVPRRRCSRCRARPRVRVTRVATGRTRPTWRSRPDQPAVRGRHRDVPARRARAGRRAPPPAARSAVAAPRSASRSAGSA